MDLTKQKCVPCEGGTLPLNPEEINNYMSYLKTPWEVIDNPSFAPPSQDATEGQGKASEGKGKKIRREFKFKNFKEAMGFVNKVAEIAESEGHHPDIYIFYNKVDLELLTHAIKGLSTNDFIMASKIELIE